MKTITSLSSAKVGMTKLAAIGKTKEEIMAFLQPITIDLHMAKNPYANYNYYLSTTILPGVILLLVFLLTPYSIGTEVKFGRSREWIHLSGNNIYVAMFGKMLPQTLLWLIVIYGYEFYIYSILHFPHPGGALPVLLLGLLAVLSCQGFGIFIYGVVPSVRMSMSMGALWGIVSASICGATYPVFSMNPMAEALATLFPLRHYYMFYQIAIFNGYPLHYAMPYLLALIVFSALPILTLWNTKKSMLVDNYLP
jgi:ABC-2 type transport system permease protein